MSKRILIWTSQMAKHRLAKELGVFFLDTTAMTGVRHFAPEMRNVRLYKDGVLGEEEYTRLYVDKMRQSVKANRSVWDDLAQHDRIIAACYCKAGAFCHRHLWLDLVTKYFAAQKVLVIDMGEFTCADDLQKAYMAIVPERRIVKYPKTLSEANTLSRTEKINTFLVASYAYYILHSNVLPDTVYDMICTDLWHVWEKLSEEDQKLIDKDSLAAGTYFDRKKEDYPEWVEAEAKACVEI